MIEFDLQHTLFIVSLIVSLFIAIVLHMYYDNPLNDEVIIPIGIVVTIFWAFTIYAWKIALCVYGFFLILWFIWEILYRLAKLVILYIGKADKKSNVNE